MVSVIFGEQLRLDRVYRLRLGQPTIEWQDRITNVGNVPVEGIMLRDGFFIAIYLANNEYGLCFVIPDAPWVNGELRELIEDILDPLPESL